MDFVKWVEEEVGRAEALAAHFKIDASAVSQWKANGVPFLKMQGVCSFSRDQVTLEEMLAARTKLMRAKRRARAAKEEQARAA